MLRLWANYATFGVTGLSKTNPPFHTSFPEYEGCTKWIRDIPKYTGALLLLLFFFFGEERMEWQLEGQTPSPANETQVEVEKLSDTAGRLPFNSTRFQRSQPTKDAAFADDVGRILRRLQPLKMGNSSCFLPTFFNVERPALSFSQFPLGQTALMLSVRRGDKQIHISSGPPELSQAWNDLT